MVVNYLNVEGIAIFPCEANPPLIVDPDAELTTAVTREGLEPIARRHPQIIERLRVIEDQ